MQRASGQSGAYHNIRGRSKNTTNLNPMRPCELNIARIAKGHPELVGPSSTAICDLKKKASTPVSPSLQKPVVDGSV